MPKEYYYPDEKEPHIHKHKGGVTFTDIGHSHRTLQKGDLVYQNVVGEVVQDLQARGAAGDKRALQIAGWIQENI